MPIDPSRNSVMLEFNSASGKQPTLKEAQKQFALADSDVDQAFGVIPLANGDVGATYLIVVEETAAQKIEKARAPGFVQNWSNPRLDPFGHG